MTEDALPEVLTTSPDYLIKGYGADHRIVYGTGQIVTHGAMLGAAETVFADPRVTYVHVRSARNTCYQAKITQA